MRAGWYHTTKRARQVRGQNKMEILIAKFHSQSDTPNLRSKEKYEKFAYLDDN